MTKRITLQQFFDKVWDHFIVEGNPRAIGPDGKCFYDDGRGNRCAIGLFMDDTKGVNDNDTVYRHGVWKRIPSLHGIRPTVLAEAQTCHDLIGKYEALAHEEAWRKFASRHHLTIPGEES